MLLAQITDFHLMGPGRRLGDRVDTAAHLREAVAHLNAMEPRPAVVLATGDLVNDGTPEQYRQLGDILGRLEIEILPIPGNHDDRSGLRDLFAGVVPDGDPDNPVDYVVDRGPLRLVGLDTTVPGEHPGLLERDQLAWLDAVLCEAPDRPTVVFQHHPPFLTGIDWMDASGLAGREREADLLSRHPQVRAVLCGHIHRPIQCRVGAAVASTWPSTGAQVALALDGAPFGYVDEPAAVALHRWTEADGLVSHLSYVNGPDRWVPPAFRNRKPPS